MLSLRLDALRNVPGEGKEEGEGVLADGRPVRAAGVGEDDVVLDQLRQILQVVHPGAGGLDPAQRLPRAQEIGGGKPVEHVRVDDLHRQLLRRRDRDDLHPRQIQVVEQREMRGTFR